MTTPSNDAAPRPGRTNRITMLASLLVCAALAGCDTPPSPPRSQFATATAAANATTHAASSTGTASLPAFTADPGWVAVVQVADSSKLGEPQGGGGGTASTTMTIGRFTLSHDALVVVQFSCVGRAGEHSSVTISVSDADSFTSTCAESAGPVQRNQMQLLPAWAGRTMTVTATITTDGSPPNWTALVEQPE